MLQEGEASAGDGAFGLRLGIAADASPLHPVIDVPSVIEAPPVIDVPSVIATVARNTNTPC
ncbi:MAG: hypothetical protein ABI780_11750, partial [Ardenticatenales bacterium]